MSLKKHVCSQTQLSSIVLTSQEVNYGNAFRGAQQRTSHTCISMHYIEKCFLYIIRLCIQDIQYKK